jgi:hypothetical protein
MSLWLVNSYSHRSGLVVTGSFGLAISGIGTFACLIWLASTHEEPQKRAYQTLQQEWLKKPESSPQQPTKQS